jgi:large subunit ribosomal protein L32
MPNPKRKHTPARRDSRRAANWKLETKSLSSCPQCGAMRLPHRVCAACGTYNGKIEVVRKEKKGDDQGPK